MVDPITEVFPGLQTSPFQITSPTSRDYNCIAWAAGDTTRWWWPDPDSDASFWPPGIPREETIDAFVAAFAALGYAASATDELEVGFEQVALSASGTLPTHAARQLPNGRWTSKLGLREDIEHDLHALSGEAYGSGVLILKRSVSE